jgi:hypothetical protein
MPYRKGSGFFEDLGNPDRWANEIFNPRSNAWGLAGNVAQMARGRPSRHQGAGFFEDLGNPNRWANEIFNPRSNAWGLASNMAQMARGRPRRHGSGFFEDLGNPDRWANEIFNPRSNAWGLASNVAQMARGRGRAGAGRGPSARGAIVRQVMMEHGLTLPQASRYVKEHGLYKK